MKHLFSNGRTQFIVALILANLGPALQAESRCPGSAASVTPRFVQRAVIIIPVRINHAGPYDFMVDTGSQVTVIDPSLALELDLKLRGTVGLVSVASYAQASVTVLDRLEAGSHLVENPLAVVHDLRDLRTADPRIRGVLGENFLAHFDLLIDYAHKLLCLDDTNSMRESVRGEHIPLVPPQDPESELPFMERLVVSVQLSGTGTRKILLQLDSGSDGPILYARTKEPDLMIMHQATRQGANMSKAQQAFAVLPPQDMRIGSRILGRISFVTPVSSEDKVPSRQEDGLLPTELFQRVFISSSDHYVIFDFGTAAAESPNTISRWRELPVLRFSKKQRGSY
jgi:Aspartyl protease